MMAYEKWTFILKINDNTQLVDPIQKTVWSMELFLSYLPHSDDAMMLNTIYYLWYLKVYDIFIIFTSLISITHHQNPFDDEVAYVLCTSTENSSHCAINNDPRKCERGRPASISHSKYPISKYLLQPYHLYLFIFNYAPFHNVLHPSILSPHCFFILDSIHPENFVRRCLDGRYGDLDQFSRWIFQ